jgi:PKD repeat protein
VLVGGASGAKDAAVGRLDGAAPADVAPVAAPGGPYEVAEGGYVMLDARASSDSDGRVSAFEWDFNYDGVTFDTDATGSTTPFHAAGIDGPATRTIAVRVTDSMGAVVVVRSATVNVVNAPPTLLIAGAANAPSGSAYTLSLAAADPGADSVTSWTIDWGDGQRQTVPGGTTSLSHVFADRPTGLRITATASDEDGSYAASNGALDPTFGAGGIAHTQRDDLTSFLDAGAAPDPLTGKTYVMTGEPWEIARFNPDGSQDMT